MQRKTERDEKLAAAWKSGKFKTYSSLARTYHTSPKIVQRAVQRLCDPFLWVKAPAKKTPQAA